MKPKMSFIGLVLLSLLILLWGCSNTQNSANVPDEKQVEQVTQKPQATIEDTGLELKVKPLEKNAEIVIPDVQVEDFPVPENEAMAFTRQMKIGWNLGNTFDAFSDSPSLKNELDLESYWCGVMTTREMIASVKNAGFNTLRIPVSWHNHVSGNQFTISEAWMDRVQQVVDYAMAEDMYVILNIHHDIAEAYYYPSAKHMDNSTAYVKAVWRQIAERFKNYNEHLIFESVNEPRLTGTPFEWWLNMSDPLCLEAVECVNKLNQVFVDTVRASGGNNKTRYLMVPGYCASADYALLDEFRLPTDTQDNKIIVSVHAYTPYAFALQSPGEPGSISAWRVTNPGSRRDIDWFMTGLYEKFIQKGIPVVIGEFGARDKGGNLQDRVEFSAYYIRSARARGMTCLWWDNNSFAGNGENFGLFERSSLSWPGQIIVDAMMKYAE